MAYPPKTSINKMNFVEYNYPAPPTKSRVKNYNSFHRDLKRNQFTNVPEYKLVYPSLKIKGEMKKDRFYYTVRIVTENPDNMVFKINYYIELAGESAQTGKIPLTMKSAPKSLIIEDYIIKCRESLGDVTVVTIGTNTQSSIWHVDYIYVTEYMKGPGKIFPCYHWIGPEDYFSLAACCGILEQVKNIPNISQLRKIQLENRKKAYKWNIFPDLGTPSAVGSPSPPSDERFDNVKHTEFLGNLIKGGISSFGAAANIDIQQSLYANLGVSTTANISPKSLQDYHNIALILQGKSTFNSELEKRGLIVCEVARWTSDIEFGRQILNGVNPVIIQRCTKLPSNFVVKHEMVKPSLNTGHTLEEEIQQGKVYICDLSELMDGLHCKDGNFCTAPLCLLYVDSADRLIPIAIQLYKVPSKTNPVFLPSDNWIDWIMAKTYFFSALAQHHQLSTHFNSCHAAMEAYGVATMRNIPDSHPVYKLLRPAFHYTMAINVQARKELINEGGILDRLFSIGFDHSDNYPPNSGKNELTIRTNKKYSVHWTNIKRDIHRRGVETIPNYYYRDDAISMWDTIEDYVTSIIEIFYNNDIDVEQDGELKEWSKEVHNFAFPAFHENPCGRGFPRRITTKKDLIEYCTLIIFTGSAQHAAVNFGQFQTYAFVPNAPMNMRQPPPNTKGKSTIEDLMKALPTYISAALGVSVVFSLSQFGLEEVYMGGLPEMWYTGERERKCVTAFWDSLAKRDKVIKERNKNLDIPYEYLLSHNVPMSITI